MEGGGLACYMTANSELLALGWYVECGVRVRVCERGVHVIGAGH